MKTNVIAEGLSTHGSKAVEVKPPAGGERAPSKSHSDFTAALFSVLMESALPKGQSIFGKGFAGQMARSELAQKLAHVLASDDTLGIVSRLTRHEAGDQKSKTGVQQ